MAIAVIIVAVVLVAGLLVWFARSKHPEQTSSHTDVHDTNAGTQLYGETPSGPAGPDLESQDPDQTGNRLDTPPPRD